MSQCTFTMYIGNSIHLSCCLLKTDVKIVNRPKKADICIGRSPDSAKKKRNGWRIKLMVQNAVIAPL